MAHPMGKAPNVIIHMCFHSSQRSRKDTQRTSFRTTSQRSTKTHKDSQRISVVVTNRFGGIVDLGLLLHSSKNQGVWVEEERDLDEL
jgi:hypothetical protein